MAFIVTVKIYDEDLGVVTEQLIDQYDGSYGYEVESLFDKLGRKVAKKIDPYHDKD